MRRHASNRPAFIKFDKGGDLHAVFGNACQRSMSLPSYRAWVMLTGFHVSLELLKSGCGHHNLPILALIIVAVLVQTAARDFVLYKPTLFESLVQ
jgi:hypothetical protein